jgi:hypothetical protein
MVNRAVSTIPEPSGTSAQTVPLGVIMPANGAFESTDEKFL